MSSIMEKMSVEVNPCLEGLCLLSNKVPQVFFHNFAFH